MPAFHGASFDPKIDAAGFRTLEQPPAGLRIEAWGYWSPDIAGAFARDGLVHAQQLREGAEFHLDAKALKPQSAEGQDALRVVFRALSGASLGKATLSTDNALTRMQLTRLVRECGLDRRVQFE